MGIFRAHTGAIGCIGLTVLCSSVAAMCWLAAIADVDCPTAIASVSETILLPSRYCWCANYCQICRPLYNTVTGSRSLLATL